MTMLLGVGVEDVEGGGVRYLIYSENLYKESRFIKSKKKYNKN